MARVRFPVPAHFRTHCLLPSAPPPYRNSRCIRVGWSRSLSAYINTPLDLLVDLTPWGLFPWALGPPCLCLSSLFPHTAFGLVHGRCLLLGAPLKPHGLLSILGAVVILRPHPGLDPSRRGWLTGLPLQTGRVPRP